MSKSAVDNMSRREFLARLAAATSTGALISVAGPVIEKAYGAGPCSGHLADIEHIVLLMQENRSFDHYFGTLSGTDGFSTASPLFAQKGWNPQTQSLDPAGITIPYRFDTTRPPLLNGACINDPDHDWVTMHLSWNGGACDNWLPAQARSRSVANTPVTMGYHARQDLPVHFMLADTFTVCDKYHCSVLGPTFPNRLYWLSAWLDPDGTDGGPLLETLTNSPIGKYSWRTMPQNLSDAGVSWKIYSDKILGPVVNNYVGYDQIMQWFKQAGDPRSDLARFGVAPTYPHDFAADVKANRLPKVSWLIPNFVESEHSAMPNAGGAVAMLDTMRILLSNPAVWEKTALIISYDENGGYFDHVVPPTAPPGTPGEYVTVPDIDNVVASGGIRGPIGLGFRVPCLVISPYSRGGLMVHDVFDHTSQLRLIERRFGVPVPNLSAWRRSITGDMTSTFNFAVPPNPSQVNLTRPRVLSALAQCGLGLEAVTGIYRLNPPYRVPYPQTMPAQELTPARGIPSGPC
ncbi:phospholipase C [Mycobacterium angelicum]|uniref:phospholipase C n=1 Tax=Mycobacterium angelicum TaxID=470074 RepID=A0A1X0A438_MYCAN|nr:phospholipase C [Mycobacterium angelicum]MCV7197822.1 phospholipase C [Mycobacterium angelicum]ORA24784.1 phospholipase [Mycobacterium angelicum]